MSDSDPAPASPSSASADSVAAPGPAAAPRALPPQAAERDSVPAPRKPSRFDQPRWVMLRSLLVPGWGQMVNGSWIKAAGIAGGEIWLALRLLDDRRDLDRLEREVAQAAGDDERERLAVDAFNSRLTTYTNRQWLLGGVVAFSLLDAYIDAHFHGFKVEFESDPALSKKKAAGRGMRISLRRAF